VVVELSIGVRVKGLVAELLERWGLAGLSQAGRALKQEAGEPHALSLDGLGVDNLASEIDIFGQGCAGYGHRLVPAGGSASNSKSGSASPRPKVRDDAREHSCKHRAKQSEAHKVHLAPPRTTDLRDPRRSCPPDHPLTSFSLVPDSQWILNPGPGRGGPDSQSKREYSDPPHIARIRRIRCSRQLQTKI